MSTSSLWQNNACGKYDDYPCADNNDMTVIKYDKPRKMRCRDHLIKEGALFFRKGNKKWSLIGEVKAVHHHVDNPTFVTLDVRKYHDENTFRTKTDAVIHFGYKPLGNFERIHGVINLQLDESNWLL